MSNPAWRRLNRPAQRTVEFALREALSLGHNYIGPEHILLALARLDDPLIADVLRRLSTTPDHVRQAVTLAAADRSIRKAKESLDAVSQAQDIAVAEAESAVSLTQAQAQTQFAGSGLTVNMYGIPLDNATAIGTEMDWFGRTRLSQLVGALNDVIALFNREVQEQLRQRKRGES